MKNFQVSKSLGTIWIKEEQLTLCIDRLDEVAALHRSACVQALNHFWQTHGRTEVVVCSRLREYEALLERLRIRCAIYIQPLSDQQIGRYLAQVGESLSALSTFLNHNAEIKSLANSPLISSVMSLAYQGCSSGQLAGVNSVQAFQKRLFDTYVERMFLRRGSATHYTEQQTEHWLVWMAQQMAKSSQTVFFIESLQPGWLPA